MDMSPYNIEPEEAPLNSKIGDHAVSQRTHGKRLLIEKVLHLTLEIGKG